MLTTVTTWYLEMLSEDWLRPSFSEHPRLNIVQAEVPSPELSRFLYTAVGGDWYWLDRLSWSYERWLTYLDRPQVQTWVAYVAGTPAGYVELEAQLGGDVEIAYFGLLRPFLGQGIGKHLLTVGVQQAWRMDATRVWVHTCSLDSPFALKNYEARGFKRYREEVHTETLPEQPFGPWVPYS
ncbi:MAG TPA: GNAT family N-acetyltransferase [Synechococcales cyanobacterium M55_K2018_004]|nr:GNAT family N-acetyltransferase [Synechococcales cyanobacterium M55_K2018_004]